MRQDSPIYTFWTIICMTIVALLIARWFDLPGDRAMPVFVVFMFLGVPLGELLEWASRRSKAK